MRSFMWLFVYCFESKIVYALKVYCFESKIVIQSIKYDSIRKIIVLCCNFLPFSSFLLKHILNNTNVMNVLCFYKKKKRLRENTIIGRNYDLECNGDATSWSRALFALCPFCSAPFLLCTLFVLCPFCHAQMSWFMVYSLSFFYFFVPWFYKRMSLQWSFTNLISFRPGCKSACLPP